MRSLVRMELGERLVELSAGLVGGSRLAGDQLYEMMIQLRRWLSARVGAAQQLGRYLLPC